ncbi:MAG: I78 family peptidase inhibitor [Thalassobaculum sp.]|uniref:I78 family peptidase inhibitor n=1 Tax=Thalassobaculum sp. TaxID=2022740 RepID=UPI0032ECDA83
MTWVYKEDGTRQCGMGQEVTLEEMRTELEGLIGANNVLEAEKRILPLMFPSVCGGPNGSVNAYRITDDGVDILFHGIVGQNGFQLWIWPDPVAVAGDPDVPLPLRRAISAANDDASVAELLQGFLSRMTAVGQQPTQISELIGRRSRHYRTGDALTMDFRPDRVNIEVNAAHEIVRIWFG